MWYEVPAFRLLLIVILATILLSLAVGCASYEGVKMNDDEAKACKEQGCTVWADDELKALYLRGVKDGIKHARGIREDV
jgi:hypothetical protein